MRPLALFLALLAAPAHAQAPLAQAAGPVTAIDAPVFVPGRGSQHFPSIAFGAGVYLAVWTEFPNELDRTRASIHMSRLKADDGTALDTPPIVLINDRSDVELPAVAFDGERFLVAWHQAGGIGGVWIEPSGAISTDTVTIPVAGTPQLAITGGGTDGNPAAMIVYRSSSGTAGGFNVLGRLLKGAAPGTSLTIASDTQAEFPSVAVSGGKYLVSWSQSSPAGAYAAHVDPSTATPTVTDLERLDSAPGAVLDVFTGAGGGDFLVVWRQGNQLAGRFISEAGVVAASPVTLHTSPSGTASLHPQVAYLGSDFFLAYERGQSGLLSIYGHRVGKTGPIDSTAALTQASPQPTGTGFPLPVNARVPAFASAGNAGRLIWARVTSGATLDDVYTVPVAATAPSAQASVPAARGLNAQRSPAVAWNGTRFLAVWEDTRNIKADNDPGTDLRGRFFNREGQPEGDSFDVIVAPGDQRYPALAALPDGRFLLAWTDTRVYAAPTTTHPSLYSEPMTSFPPPNGERSTVWYARLDANGASLDGAGRSAEGTSSHPSRDRFPTVIADPEQGRWLLTYENDDTVVDSFQPPRVLLHVVSGTGALGSTQLLSLPGGACGAAGAFTGAGWLLAVERGCASRQEFRHQPTNSDVVAVPVSSDGVPDTANLVVLGSDPDLYEMAPAVAATANGVAVVWEQHDGVTVQSKRVPASAGRIHGRLIAPSGKLGSIVDVVPPGSPARAPRWPQLTATGQGYFLTWIDQTDAQSYALRAARLLGDLSPNPRDLGSDPAQAAVLSDGPTLRSLEAVVPASFPEITAPNPDPVPGVAAVGDAGQALLVYASEPTPAVGRAQARLVPVRNGGDRCLLSESGFGCTDGRCERDPEADDSDAGLCCAEACSGPCQRCTANGCVGTPAKDSLCGTLSCAALDTECRTYKPSAVVCAAFGECGASNDLSVCTEYDPAPDGTACTAPGCTQAAACQAGTCVCGDLPRDVGGPRALPPGCSAAPGAPGGGAALWLAGALALLVCGLRARGRRLAGAGLALLVALGLSACNDPNVLEIDLALDDATLSETASVRIVIKNSDAPFTFPASPAGAEGRADEQVRNVDVDGDGRVEIVADLLPPFPFLRGTTYLKVVPTPGTRHNVTVGAQALNRFGNPIAAARGESAVLPGARVRLHPTCDGDCSGARTVALGDPIALDPGVAVTALGAAASAAGEAIVAVGLAGAGDAAEPNGGAVWLLSRDTDGRTLTRGEVPARGAAGEQLGAALLVDDLDGDGQLDLVLGAPGAAESNGRVVVVYGPLGATPPIGDPAVTGSVLGGPGERLGATLALAHVGGEKRLAIGAPGLEAAGGRDPSGGAVYLLPLPARGDSVTTVSQDEVQVPRVTGPSGAHLGRALSARGAFVAAGAPGTNTVVLLDAATDFATTAPAEAGRRWVSTAQGGLGTAVALIDLEGDGALELAATRPGSGTVELVRTQADVLGDEAVVHAAQVAAPGVHFAAGLAGTSTVFGEQLVALARPEPMRGPQGATGAAYVLWGSAIAAAGPRMPADGDRWSALVATLADARLTRFLFSDVLVEPGSELIAGDDQGRLYVLPAGGAQ